MTASGISSTMYKPRLVARLVFETPTDRLVWDVGRAKAIELVTVISADIKSDEMGDADIARHLARHFPKVEVKNITATDLDVPNAILSHAADTSADFIVMGGYGHSRLREFILGGATRGILATMTIPTLMSH